MNIEKLEKLTELKEKNILTEEEFNIQKKELLSNSKQSQYVSKKQNRQDLSLWYYFAKCMTKKYSCWNGRARRKEYFGFTFFNIIIYYILALSFSLLPISDATLIVILKFIDSAFLVPSTCVLIRRMHDVNMSGWWILTLIVPLFAIFFKSDMNKNKYGEVPAGIIKQ